MGVIDNFKLRQAGAMDAQSDFRLHRTDCCGVSCVEDHEHAVLYTSPNDLMQTVSLLRGPKDPMIPCPFCGETRWSFLEIQELAEVPQEWRWACVEK